MELNKKKYSLQEVEKLLDSCSREYKEKLNNQKAKISFLIDENKRLMDKVEEYKEKDALISSTLLSAQKKADEMEKTIKDKYTLVVENLKKFVKNWQNYFEYLKDKYPNYDNIQQVIKLKEALKIDILDNDDKETVELMEEKLKNLSSNTEFMPRERINNYIAVTSENGFNLEEVLNPGKLELEDLCKELGLME